MTIAEIGELTFPQIQCLLYGGAEPVHRIESKDEMLDWIKQVEANE